MESGISDEGYQDQILPHVSRTFALTIPQLPPALRTAVTNAYLLCRIADTIEDEPTLPPAATQAYLDQFVAVLGGRGDPSLLARELTPLLSDWTLATERDLVGNMGRVLNVTASLSEPKRAAIRRCLEQMCYGMPLFQSTASLKGLPRLTDLDDYCYYVAGDVGDMLTELFCDYSPAIARRRSELQALAVSFAQGLQMAAAGGFHPLRGGPVAVGFGTARCALCRRHAGADRRRARSFAPGASLHLVNTGQGGGYSPLLPLGDRARRADFA
jgi:farnesyl-diphosphate farnesyltransferase